MTSRGERARIFGSFAADYQRWRPAYPEAAVDWLLPPGATSVADVGAGTGKLTALLQGRGLAVIAVEPDPGMVAELRRQLPGVVALCAPAEALPLEDGSVDAVLVAQAWHWFDHVAAVAEARRVLRPGGWLGLMGNGAEAVEPWQIDLALLDPDTGGGTREPDPSGNPWQQQGLVGLPFEAARFPWREQVSAQGLRARLATHSGYAVMPAAERDQRLDQIEALVSAEILRTGLPTAPFDHVAYCVRVRP